MSNQAPAQEGAGLVGVTKDGVVLFIDGERYHFRTEPRCIVCNDPHRHQIEADLIHGRSYLRIVRGLPEGSAVLWSREGERLTDEQALRRVQEHVYRGHSDRDVAVARSLMEAAAERSGLDMAQVADTIVTERGILSLVQQQGFQRIVKGEVKPTIKDAMEAGKILREIDSAGGGRADGMVFHAAMTAVMRIVGNYLEPEQMQWLYAELQEEKAVQDAFAALAVEAGGQQAS